MKKIGILTSDDMMPKASEPSPIAYLRDEQMGKLVPAFEANGMELTHVAWRNSAAVAGEYDALLPLLVWDYFEGNDAAFLAEMEAAKDHTLLLNCFETINWNAVKTYLDELSEAGAPTIETILVEKVTEESVELAFDRLQTDQLVIKPQVGGGAWRQVLYKKFEPFPNSSELPPGEAMIQSFLPSVQSEGEFSFLYFGGKFSHALVKRPKSGDYRIQEIYGGTEESYSPSADELASAKSVLQKLNKDLNREMPVYARVDLLRGRDGALKLIELELLEPYLYLNYAEGLGGENKGAMLLAEAVASCLAN